MKSLFFLALLASSSSWSADLVREVTLPNRMPLKEYRLSNGLKLIIIQNHAAPIFSYHTWFRVGSRDEKLDPRLQKTGLAHLFEHMMFRSTASYPDGEFDRLVLENGGVGENANTWNDRTAYFEDMPQVPGNLELIARLESDRMANLHLTDELINGERGAVIGERNLGQDNPSRVAGAKLYEEAFLVHPYRYTVIGTEEEIRSFTQVECDYFYRTYYAPNNATVMIAGDVEFEETVFIIERLYGGMTSQDVPHRTSPIEEPQRAVRTAQITHSQLTQPMLMIGYHSPETTHPDTAPLLVLNYILSGSSFSALNRAVVDTGLGVDLYSSMDLFRDPGLLTIEVKAQDGHESTELLQAIDQTLSAVPSQWNEVDLEIGKNGVLRGFYDSYDANDDLLALMGEYISSADDPLYVFSLVDQITRVSLEDVRRVASQYLDPSKRTIVVSLPPAQEQLR